MNEKLENILRLALEIEGLALLASSNRHELTPRMLELLSEKATLLQASVMQIPAPEACADAAAATEPLVAEEADATAASATFEQKEDAAPVESVDMAIVEDDENIEDDDEPLMAIVEDDEEEPAEDPDTTRIPEPVKKPEEKSEEKLEDKLARSRAADIFRAFTINDKFRFIRSLFRGSEQEFDDTLATIASMSSFAEAKEYFFDDLCWNPADPDVEDFMETVRTHFEN